MAQVETIDHLAIPVTDMPKAERFYMDLLGMNLEYRRLNPDGKPRNTFVNNGSRVGLFLPGTEVPPTQTGAPRFSFVYPSEESLNEVLGRLRENRIEFLGPVFHDVDFPLRLSVYVDDPAGNHVELCVLREALHDKGINHIAVETANLKKALAFYQEALGIKKEAKRSSGEVTLQLKSGQLLILKEVSQLSERSRVPGRGTHVDFEVTHEDFEEVVRAIPVFGGEIQGDHRGAAGLRPEDEKSVYFADADGNPFQMTAFGEGASK